MDALSPSATRTVRAPMKRQRAPHTRPAFPPELEAARAALSVLSRSPGWRHWSALGRFQRSYVVVPGPLPHSECHHWIGVTSDEGYGRYTARGRTVPAHRFALEDIAERGPIGRRRVYRSCGNTACVNPDHLTFDATSFDWGDPLTAPKLDGIDIPHRAAARYWEKVDKGRDGNCWWWTGKAQAQGYGRLTIRQGWATDAHRMAYALAHGSIPDGPHICHGPECEEVGGAGRLCVNPAHLIADTAAANMADKAGGHFRRPLEKIPVSPETRRLMVEFLPHAIAVSQEQGDLDEQASLEEMLALDATIDHGEPGTPAIPFSPLQVA